MGIQGLLPFLKKIHKPMNISQFKGCTVAIDAYCWLHKGAFSCADKLALGEKTDMYVYYCMKYVDYLLKVDIKPIMVFDGCHLPSKKEVEKSRRERRELYRKKAAEFLRNGNRTEARECLQKCIDITPQMALELINVCRERGVDCIVAPYEADSQLAYLNKSGIAQVIITEDSDLLLFGCEKVMFKMDFHGNGMLIEKEELNQVLELQQGFYTFDKFRQMCILSGCDYLASLPGIGLATACKVFKKTRLSDMRILLKKLSSYLKKSVTVSTEYIENFIKAENTFLYQLCFDPIKREVVPLNPYPPEIIKEDLTYAGSYYSRERSVQISLGNIDLYTGQQMNDYNPDTFQPKYAKQKSECLHRLSVWNHHYRIKPKLCLTEIQQPVKPSLAGREKVINLPPKLPVKRPRSDDTLPHVPANEELVNLYEESPAKRLRSDEVTSQIENDQSDSDDFEFPSAKTQNKTKSQSPNKEITAADLCDISMEEEKAEKLEKEKKIKAKVSPSRNRFAVLSSKKERFNLNEKRPNVIIKSRFFAQGEINHESSDNKKDECDTKGGCETNTEIKQVKSEPEENKTCEATTPELPKLILPKISSPNNKTKSAGTPKSRPSTNSKSSKNSNLKKSSSLSSAFSWSKFKLTKSDSSGNMTTNSVNTAFQSVLIKKELDNSDDVKTQEPIQLPATENSFQSESQTSLCSLVSLDSCSQKSNLYSLDSVELPSSQNTEEFQSQPTSVIESSVSTTDTGLKKTISSFSVCSTNGKVTGSGSDSTVRSDYFSDNKDEPIVIDEDSNDNTSTSLSKASSCRKQVMKKKCRVSGLSKSSRKKTSSKVVDVSQTKLKDLFSRFQRKKSESCDKLKEEDIEVVCPIDSTPESHTSSKTSKLSAVQRKLLP